MAVQFPNNFDVTAPKHIDNRSTKTVSGASVPYASVAEANAAIPSGRRFRGLQVIIDIAGKATVYHYEQGTADVNLVAMATGSGGSITIDPTPVSGSSNAVSSGGVYAELGTVNNRLDTVEDLLDANVLPAQAGNAGKVLTTDGTAPTWEEIEVIPGGTSAQLIQGDGSFVNKSAFQAALNLTTTGTSGAATLIGGTLNIPQYSGGGSAPTGTPRRMAMFDASGNLIPAPFQVAYPSEGYAEISSIYSAGDINYSFGFEFQKNSGKIGPNGNANLQLRGQNGVGAVIVSTDAFFRILNDAGTDTVPEYADNAAAMAASRPIGFVYRTGDTLKIVHS